MQTKASIRKFLIKTIIRPQAATATVTPGTGIDRRGYNHATVVLELGAVSGTTPTCDVKIQESDASGSGFVDVTGAVFSQKAAAAASKTYVGSLDLRPRKRYLRAVATIAGTTPSFGIAVQFVLSSPGVSVSDTDWSGVGATPEFNVI